MHTMSVTPEPRFAKIAAMIGDPTRARMLSALMGGQYLAAGELADAAGVSAQTASTHITKLLDSELVVEDPFPGAPQRYPHVYTPIPVSAVVATTPWNRPPGQPWVRGDRPSGSGERR